MAQIDVSEILVDPDFIDPISLVTRVPSVNYLGEASLSETRIESVGSVQPASYRTVQKLPEAMRVANVMAFWFKGVITAASPGKYASILIFKGQRFQVQTVVDWSTWGAGWCEGTCVAEGIT